MNILINNEQDKVRIGNDINIIIESVVMECLKVENKSGDYEVSITFVDDEEIRELNKQYRNIDKSTDVLSFPLLEDETELPYVPLLGDVVISAETAQRQSEEYGHDLNREIAYLAAHSMFHLLGYDHMEENEKRIMREKEKKVMENLKILR